MSQPEDCPFCRRAATERLACRVPPLTGPCDHIVFKTDAMGYIGAGFALEHCFVHVERGTPSGKTFLEIDRDIVGILGKHVEIVNGTGYAESPDEALTAATAAVCSYLRDLGYSVPD